MKPAKSRLIETFLKHVRRGDIAGIDKPGGPAILELMSAALQRVLDGESPDVALKVERTAGQPQDARTIALAVEIHSLRKIGIEWGAIHRIKEIEYEEAGLKPLTKERLKRIYKDNRDWLKGRDAIAEFVARFRQHMPRTEE